LREAGSLFERNPTLATMRPLRTRGAQVLCCEVAKVLFFFEDEVGGGGAGGYLDPVRNAGRDVDDVSGAEDNFFSALDAGSESFAGAAGAAVGMFSLHGAAGDEGDRAFVDDNLVGKELMTLGVAGVEADDKDGVVVAVVVEWRYGEACGACLGGFDQLGFALLEVGGGVDGGLGGLGC
jgi:hypothetical protein